jgi:hypothetical protein
MASVTRPPLVALAALAFASACQLAYPTHERAAIEAAPDGGTPGAEAGEASGADGGGTPDASPSAFPDSTNTGPGSVPLTPQGALALTTQGQVVDGVDVNGPVEISANDVTLKHCRITSTEPIIVDIDSTLTGVRIEDCEIVGNGKVHGSIGIAGPLTLLRSSIHGVNVAMTFTGSATIQDSYIWGLASADDGSYHGIKMDGSVNDVHILHNTIINDHDATAAVMINDYAGPARNVTVDRNRLAGGAFTLYSDAAAAGTISGVVVTNNRFRKGSAGYASVRNNSVTQSNNVDDVTGEGLLL